MNSTKQLLGAFLFCLATVTASFAQVFWSNYSPSGVTDDIWCVTYANGTFAAVTEQGNLLTSTNGLNWSSQAIDSGVWLVSIAYGNGTWVVVGDQGTILVSSDLKTWVKAASGTSNKFNGVSYNGTIWLAAGEAGTIVTSPDAKTWALQPPIVGVTGFLHGITTFPLTNPVSNPGITWYLYLVSGANGVILKSEDISGSDLGLLAYGNEPFEHNPPTTSQNLEAILYETVNASPIAVVVGGGGTIMYADNLFTIVSPGNNYWNWTLSSSIIPNVIFRGLTYGSGTFVTAGEQGTIMSSSDGINWTQRFSGDSPSTLSTATLLSAAYSEPLQRFVVTGTGGTILVSNAAPTVFGNVSTRGYVSNTQTFIGGFYVQGTAPRTVLIRADGPVLGTFSVPSPLPDPVLTVYDNTGNVIATNTGWTTNTSPSTISSAAQQVGAFALPNPSMDSALLLTLQPGAYTAQITSATGNSGIALFEAYAD